MQRVERLELTTNFPIGPVYSYVVFGEKLTLIDAGLKNKQGWDELNKGLHLLGLGLTDIEQIVITHHHNDHTGMVDWILEKNPSVSIYAHKDTEMILKDESYLAWSSEFFERLFLEFGLTKELAIKWAYRKGHRDYFQLATVDEVLQDGDSVPGLPGWKVIETLGHSQDHISLYCGDTQQFICGDNIIKGVHGGIFLDAPKQGEERAKPLLQYLNNLEICRKLPAKVTYSGHGPIIDNLNGAIDGHINNIENRANRVINTLKKLDNSATGLEIIQDMYRGRYEKAVITFVFEIVSVLDMLQERNIVFAEKLNGVYQYRLINGD
ncbi:MBL fold metallo-hydrolase [Ureibacillus chungkukjangi]|uniref:Glyoxylase-like metal-dependent hydrolase (Beta-lactamase superfamily II) n=1 Tax=Ureibacillus chungkukjangi TaxID=1202712 RepID=A0A318TWB8_9BACL|nr:MBL fold metallo-hydrolase [Ureibacillus chungkukjangi]PYF07298.1 glyoxylase-like metal-dependent hydrolase (beta-lactamase superfamily II) [Ureibacillus chungkukjangi]